MKQKVKAAKEAATDTSKRAKEFVDGQLTDLVVGEIDKTGFNDGLKNLANTFSDIKQGDYNPLQPVVNKVKDHAIGQVVENATDGLIDRALAARVIGGVRNAKAEAIKFGRGLRKEITDLTAEE